MPASPKTTTRGDFDECIAQLLPISGLGVKLTPQSMQIINSLIDLSINRLSLNIKNLMQSSKGSAITTRALKSAILLTFPEELSKYAISEATKAVTKYHSADRNDDGIFNSTFSMAPTELCFKKYMSVFCNVRMQHDFKIYATAMIEYLTLEILELSGKISLSQGADHITPMHIQLALKDDELFVYFNRPFFA